MVVTDLNQYDLTGNNALFKRVDRRFMVFTANQRIDFQEAVYPESIKVWEVKADRSTVRLLQGSGPKAWEISSACIDNNAISIAKLRYATRPTTSAADPITWDRQLVCCIYMQDLVDPSPEYQIVVEYQAFEKDMIALNRDSLGPEYSPGLMRTLVHRVDELINIHNPVEDYSAITVANMKCMPEDLTGSAPTNYVVGEEHNVSSSANKFVVRPQNGSFYRAGVKVEYKSSNSTIYTELQEGIGYEIVGINHEKTSISYPECGVYEYIIIKQPVEGIVHVTYHAFGGEVTQADINTLKEVVRNIYQTLEDKKLLTTDNLYKSELIRNINYRLALIEETIKVFQAQEFQYITSAVDQWADIAFINDSVWMSGAGVPSNGYGEFRIEIGQAELYLDIKVSYDTVSGDFKISTYHISAPTYAEYGSDYFSKRLMPKFRIIWNEDLDDGLMLQMTLSSSEVKPYTVRVLDRTGANSHWVLIDNQNGLRPNNSSGVSSELVCDFPNGKRWTTSTGNRTDVVPVHPNGYTVYASTVDIAAIDDSSLTHSDDPENGTVPTESKGGLVVAQSATGLRITGRDIDFKYVTGVRFEIYDKQTNSYRYGVTHDIESVTDGIRAAAMYFYDDLCMIEATFEYVSNAYTMRLNTRTGTNSLDANRFALTQIDLLSASLDTPARKVSEVSETDTGSTTAPTSEAPMSLTRANTVVNFGRL